MLQAIFLDTGPLGLVTRRAGIPDVDACHRWVRAMMGAGVRLIVPEIADYEVRRELLRAGKTAGLARLDQFLGAEADRYLPITTAAMRKAAELWADIRKRHLATADVLSLDADVILAAQVLTAGFPETEVIVASANVRHIRRYVAADQWTNITP